MSEEKLTHYRKVFKSDHLGSADLEEFLEEGMILNFTIKEVKQYEYDPKDKKSGVVVAGRRISANVAFFVEDIKPMVLNAGNSDIVKKFAGGMPWVQKWENIFIELYIEENVRFGSEITSGVRIRPIQPVKEKPLLTPKHKNWEKAKAAVQEGNATFDSLNKNYIISQTNFELLCG